MSQTLLSHRLRSQHSTRRPRQNAIACATIAVSCALVGVFNHLIQCETAFAAPSFSTGVTSMTNADTAAAIGGTWQAPMAPLASLHQPGSASPVLRGGLSARRALNVDLTGKVAFIAGIADTSGYGWAIAKELANAGATIVIGTWPPVLKIFQSTLKKSATDEARKLDDGSLMEIAKIYALDAVYDTPDQVPEDVKTNKRYAGAGPFTIQETVDQIKADFGKIDILVHSLANGPEVTKPLLETSRAGYLAASSASAYSLVSMVSRFAPIMPQGSSVLSLSYIASERVIPGYGGGMSSAKAQLESDTRTLAFEAGRKYGIRVNTISAGPLKSRAASAIGSEGGKTFIERAIDYSVANAPLSKALYADEVGRSALCLLTDLMSSVTGVTLYVDNGLHAMGNTLDSPAFTSD